MTIKLLLEGDKVLESPFTIIKPDVSEEEFWNFADEDIKCELIDGVLIIQSPASQEHEDIFSLLISLFRYYLVNTSKGRVFGSRFVMRISPKWNPEPDILVVLTKNLNRLDEGKCNGPADLVVEILSEATRDSDINTKIPKFLDEGVQEAWIIDPKNQSIIIRWKDARLQYSDPTSSDIIQSKVLPGLRIPVNWIWQREGHPSENDLKFVLGND